MGKIYNQNIEHFSDSSDGVIRLYKSGNQKGKRRKPLIFIRGHGR